MDPKLCTNLLMEFSKRSSDNVISMLFDMNEQLVMNSFILKFISLKEKVISDLASAKTLSQSLAIVSDTLSGHISLRKLKKNDTASMASRCTPLQI
jgi:hypothetical protein